VAERRISYYVEKKIQGDSAAGERRISDYVEKYKSGAVASGKDYASKPPGYKATLACQRANFGTESKRLVEHETSNRFKGGGKGTDCGIRSCFSETTVT